MDIIKEVKICNTFFLTIVYFEDIKEYEVQFSNNDDILDTDGTYSNKKDTIKVFNQWLKELIVKVE